MTWPAGLQSLTFGFSFNRSLDSVTWPAGLQSLTFGGNFNENLDNVKWPSGLQSLTFEGLFNQSLDKVTLPAGLQSVTFETFSEKLNVVWPEGLQSLSFLNIEFAEESCPDLEDSDDSDSRVDLEVVLTSQWPRALRKLVLGKLALVC